LCSFYITSSTSFFQIYIYMFLKLCLFDVCKYCISFLFVYFNMCQCGCKSYIFKYLNPLLLFVSLLTFFLLFFFSP
jgi:hypothetical protein